MKHLILAILIAFTTTATISHAEQESQQQNEIVRVEMLGLVCDFCARSIEKVLTRREEVGSVDVNLTTKLITIEFKPQQTISDDDLTKLIVDSGYNVQNIIRELKQ